jgi:hypothetical protein
MASEHAQRLQRLMHLPETLRNREDATVNRSRMTPLGGLEQVLRVLQLRCHPVSWT